MTTRKCPKCKRPYTLGVDGIVTGCDRCKHIKRDKDGNIWEPGERVQVRKPNRGAPVVVRREREL